MRAHTVFRKTVSDLASVKLLAAYFIPCLGLVGFLAWAATSDFPNTASLAQQELRLFTLFLGLSFFWAVGVPLQALVAVLSANTLAREAQEGTLKILLSKPVRRWEVVLGTYGAVVTVAVLVGLLALSATGLLLVEFSGVTTDAVSAGLLAPIPANLAFAAFGAAVVAAVGHAFAVTTRSRMRTVLPTLVFPLLYFAFMPTRLIAAGYYEEYSLYLVDVGYHFGNAFVFFHETIGEQLPLEAQVQIAIWSGVFEMPAGEPPAGGTLEPAGYVSMEASVLLLAALAGGALGVAAYRFQQMDV